MATDKHILNIPELYRMYQDGWSLRALGRLLGIDGQVLSARFRRAKLPVEKFHKKIPLETIAQLHRRGLSQTQMAEKLNVSRQVIFRAMERLRKLAPQFASVKRKTSRWHAESGEWPPTAALQHVLCPARRGILVGLQKP